MHPLPLSGGPQSAEVSQAVRWRRFAQLNVGCSDYIKAIFHLFLPLAPTPPMSLSLKRESSTGEETENNLDLGEKWRNINALFITEGALERQYVPRVGEDVSGERSDFYLFQYYVRKCPGSTRIADLDPSQWRGHGRSEGGGGGTPGLHWGGMVSGLTVWG